jgi:hypothetical protein
MPDEFFKIVFTVVDKSLECQGFCTGYEKSEWRFNELVQYIFDEYLLEFCLVYSELPNYKEARQKLRESFKNVYEYRQRKMKENGEEEKNLRGEFGELLLHAIMSEYHHTLPAISKIYYKDGPNEVVKGFDAVHVVMLNDSLELWLGEAKFYKNARKAIKEALSSVEEHLEKDYLRTEFAAIYRKIDNQWPHAAKLKKLINPRTSLDEVFNAVCIPILITYDSNVVNKHSIHNEAYFNSIHAEIEAHYRSFASALAKHPGLQVRVQLFFMPLKNKEKLVEIIDKAIEIGQK